ncbi:hypothetical protein CAPTEDRAFT_227314 [Capitella teleta]|uniref:X-ray radiation resistance-associated protein 1 n=1 Tax=Capitella teleta TaxID=283909 RepID=R7V7M3_CAPTE|nr:hypothetical protein CAPTEDRAFT_227314 [Capitella teleta]|eukprot:ELU12376.1 hypothetical protein CAPTEDRAFT_227314 [Capitella teleta]
MATSMLKLDDGSGGHAANCFPVRTLVHRQDDDQRDTVYSTGGLANGGAWLTAQKVEQRRRFKAVLCAKPRSYDDIRRERNQNSAKMGTAIIPAASLVTETPEFDDENKILDGFFLMKHCCVDDPTDLCSVNINGQNLSETKVEDFKLFDNVAYVNAAENILPLNCFDSFPILRELELPLNGLRNLKLNVGEFKHLELLDLSYNNLCPEDFLPLGLLQNLRILQLTGNNLKSIPPDLALPCASQKSGRKLQVQRFPKLEILMLDENNLEDITIFAALAGLRQLRHLNLSKNNLYAVPQLILMEGRMITQIIDSRPSSQRKLSRRRRSQKSALHLEERMRSLTETRIKNQSDSNPLHEDEVVPDDASKEQTDGNNLMADFEELNIEETHPGEDTFRKGGHPLPPPFPELRYLNVSHNQIALAFGFIGMGSCVFFSSVVRKSFSKFRKKAPALEKPNIEVKIKPERRVNTIIPSVPRCNVDELLAIEAPKRQSPELLPEEEPPETPNSRGEAAFGLGNPLPPIPATPEFEGSEGTSMHSHETEEIQEEAKEQSADAFFMTQVDELAKSQDAPQEVVQSEEPKTLKILDEKYSGYDVLFEDEGLTFTGDVPEPKDIQGNVRALRYALSHPVNYRDNKVDLENRQRPFQPYQRPKPLAEIRRKPNSERVHEALLQMKNNTVVDDLPLNDVVGENGKYPQYLAEAKDLLTEVQRRYNRVRVSSMKNARKNHLAELQNAMKETFSDVELKK